MKHETTQIFAPERKERRRRVLRLMRENYVLYLMLLPALLFIFVFNYLPMGGIVLAFKKYQVRLGIFGSPWVGLKYFKTFFSSPSSGRIIKNTIVLSLYNLLASFPLPILISLMLNQCRSTALKKTVQNVIYAPYFISVTVVVGMMEIMLSPSSGAVNTIIESLGGEAYYFFGEASAFPHLYVWSGVWQNMGFNSIIYLAALSSVSPELHEAAIMDGASKLQRIIHIDLPAILPTIVIMAILSIGRLMNLGFDKIYLMQNSINILTSEVLSTYIYKRGILEANYSLATAVGLFSSVINFILLVSVNRIAGWLTETSLW